MRTRNIVSAALLLSLLSVGLLVFLTTAESRIDAEISPVPQEILTDVVSYEFDLLKVTSNWPKSLTVENISDKEISGFEILIVAANDDGGPGEMVRWGTDPNNAKQDVLFKPKETITLPISPKLVKTFEDNGKPFLYIQVFRAFANNDPKFSYSQGAVLQQDETNPRVYHVIIDSKGRSKIALPCVKLASEPPLSTQPCFASRYSFDKTTVSAGVLHQRVLR